MSLSLRVLLGLVAGLALGVLLQAGGGAPGVMAVLTPLGGLFVDLIRMTALPLVVSLLVASIGRTAATGLGRAGFRALVAGVAILAVTAAVSVVLAHGVLATRTFDRAALAPDTTVGAAAKPAVTPGTASWLSELVTPNVVKAAADGAVLPVVVFAVLFASALARSRPDQRDAVVQVMSGIADAMQRLVGWILQLAPIGVFALAAALAARLGLSAAGALAAYVALVVVLTVVAVILLYPLGVGGSGLSPARFAAYCAPAQALAFASRSSLATMPAAMASAETIGLPAEHAHVILPLAVSVFHVGTAVAHAVGAAFLARLYGVPLGPVELGAIVAATVFTSFAVPGIPGGSIIAMVPVLNVAHLPVDGVALLLAVDAVPDMFRTTANVTGAMTLAVLGHQRRR